MKRTTVKSVVKKPAVKKVVKKAVVKKVVKKAVAKKQEAPISGNGMGMSSRAPSKIAIMKKK